MRAHSVVRCLPGLAALILAGSVTSSWAALGGTVDGIQADTLRLQATRHVATSTLYEVHELDLASGTVVREYVAANGMVFGVSWQGPFKPDLNQLLGEHFARLVAAGQERHPDHRTLRVRDPNLVIESAGRMRAFAGRGFIPGLIPPGVMTSEIK